MNEDYQTVIMYHANCPDGYACAWMFKQLTGIRRRILGKIKFHPVSNRDFWKSNDIPDISNRRVIFLDLCYTTSAMEHILNLASKVTVIDHHITSLGTLESCKGNGKFTYIFDNTKCACELTWDYLFNKDLIPWWVKHIRDKDLYIWKDNRSRAFSASFNNMSDPGIDKFDKLNIMTEKEINEFLEDGKIHLNNEINHILRVCDQANLRLFEGYRVFTVIAYKFRTDIGNTLAMDERCDFAVVYNYDILMNTWICSLRGDMVKLNNVNANLALIAKKYGGGGHFAASAFAYSGNIDELFKSV